MIQIIRILDNQVGLVFRKNRLVRVLENGLHVVLGFAKVQTYDMRQSKLVSKNLEEFIENDQLNRLLYVVDLKEDQRAIVWRNERIYDAIGPGLAAYFKSPANIEVETFEVTEESIQHRQLDVLIEQGMIRTWTEVVDVKPNERVLRYVKGKLKSELGPGRYVFWKTTSKVQNLVVEMREQSMDISGQEIMTSDKVTLRVNLLLQYRIDKPVVAVTVVDDVRNAIYRETQLELRAAIGTRKLDELLSDKAVVGNELMKAIKPRAESMGLVVNSVGIRDIILPGDMKELMNKVTEAQKQAEANLIRRREETAAARSQANTAKILSENPAIMRMKELETLQDILKGSQTTFILKSGDVTHQLLDLLKNT